MHSNDISCRENTKLVAQRTEYEVCQLELHEFARRRAGHFDDAVSFQGLVEALRNGQLAVGQLYTSHSRVVMFGGRSLLG